MINNLLLIDIPTCSVYAIDDSESIFGSILHMEISDFCAQVKSIHDCTPDQIEKLDWIEVEDMTSLTFSERSRILHQLKNIDSMLDIDDFLRQGGR